jgi:tetratricopeptide (TPR) repeat protein
MKALALLLVIVAPFSLFAQTPVPAASPSSEKALSYRTKTVWGTIQALVRPQGDGFSLEVRSETPMTGWTLKNEAGDQTLAKGGLNAVKQFIAQIPKAFQDNFKLTVFLNAEQDSVPVALQLGSKTGTTGKDIPAEAEEEYEENPDHPYHAMVRSLYERALEDLAKGDRFHALSQLKKASNLDPLQPQVQNLLEKTQGPTAKIIDPIEQARAVWKSGNKDGALSRLDDILSNEPDNEKALALKKEIEGKRKKTFSKPAPEAPQTKVRKAPAPVNEKEAQAKADQAYNLGLETYRKSDYAAAKKFWEETLQILPTHTQARRNLDRLLEDHPELK